MKIYVYNIEWDYINDDPSTWGGPKPPNALFTYVDKDELEDSNMELEDYLQETVSYWDLPTSDFDFRIVDEKDEAMPTPDSPQALFNIPMNPEVKNIKSKVDYRKKIYARISTDLANTERVKHFPSKADLQNHAKEQEWQFKGQKGDTYWFVNKDGKGPFGYKCNQEFACDYIEN